MGTELGTPRSVAVIFFHARDGKRINYISVIVVDIIREIFHLPTLY